MSNEKCKCGNIWNYCHTIWGGEKGGSYIVRYCTKCKTMEVGEVHKWRKAKDNEFDELTKNFMKFHIFWKISYEQ